MYRKYLRRQGRAALAVSVPLVSLLACGDSSTSSGGGGTTIDFPSDVATAIERMMGEPADEVGSCRAALLLDEESNADLFAFLGDSLLSAVGETGDFSEVYGTWADTSPSPEDGMGVERTSTSPSDGLRLILAGRDDLGAPVSGSLTIDDIDISITEGTSSVEIDASVSITLEEDGGDSMAFEGQLVASLATEATRTGSRGSSTTFEFQGSGHVCDLEYGFDVAYGEGTDAIETSGWYLLDPPRVNVGFGIFGLSTGIDSLSTELWVGNSIASAEALVRVVSIPDATEDCVTGAVFTDGEERGEIVSMYCATDSMTVFVITETDTIPLDEILDDLEDVAPIAVGRAYMVR